MLQLQTLQVHRSHDVEGTGKAMFCLTVMKWSDNVFLINAPPKLLDIAISNFVGAL